MENYNKTCYKKTIYIIIKDIKTNNNINNKIIKVLIKNQKKVNILYYLKNIYIFFIWQIYF